MKTLRSLIFLLLPLLLGVLAACAKQNYQDPPRDPAANEAGACEIEFVQNHLCAELVWEKKPNENEMGSFVVEFYTPGDRGNFVDLNNKLEVDLWMPSMGHGSRPVAVEKVNPGQYRVSQVYFIMHGDWLIRLKLKNGDTVLEEVDVPIRY